MILRFIQSTFFFAVHLFLLLVVITWVFHLPIDRAYLGFIYSCYGYAIIWIIKLILDLGKPLPKESETN